MVEQDPRAVVRRALEGAVEGAVAVHHPDRDPLDRVVRGQMLVDVDRGVGVVGDELFGGVEEDPRAIGRPARVVDPEGPVATHGSDREQARRPVGASIEVVRVVGVGADELLGGDEEGARAVVRGVNERGAEGSVAVDLSGGDALEEVVGPSWRCVARRRVSAVDVTGGVGVALDQRLQGGEERAGAVVRDGGELGVRGAGEAAGRDQGRPVPGPLIHVPGEVEVVGDEAARWSRRRPASRPPRRPQKPRR